MSNPSNAVRQENYVRNWQYSGFSENISLSKLYEFVEPGSRVLDIGCGTGDLGSELRLKKACWVLGVEHNERMRSLAAPRLDDFQIGDVTDPGFVASLGQGNFDVIVLADVLEHLTDGASVLRSLLPTLRPSGVILLSVPNIAHGAVRLSLMAGRFNYQEEGLLDKTHVHFYTRESLSEAVDSAGYVVVDEQSTFLGALDTEIQIPLGGIITESMVNTVEREPDGTTYQFILKILPEPDPIRRKLLQQKFRGQASRIQALDDSLQRSESALRVLEQQQEDRITGLSAQIQARAGEMEALQAQVSELGRALQEEAASKESLRQKISEMEERMRQVESRMERYSNILPIRALRGMRSKLKGLS